MYRPRTRARHTLSAARTVPSAAAPPSPEDASGFQDVGALRRPHGEADVLFDEEDGEAAPPGQGEDRLLDLGDDGRLDALGRFVQEQQPGDQRPDDGELLAPAAGEQAGAAAGQLPRHREEVERLGGGLLAVRASAGDELEVLRGGEVREGLLALRDVRHAAGDLPVRGEAAASRAQDAQVGPKMPAGPRIGWTRATFRADPSAVYHSGARRRGGGLCTAHMTAAEVELPNRRFAGWDRRPGRCGVRRQPVTVMVELPLLW